MRLSLYRTTGKENTARAPRGRGFAQTRRRKYIMHAYAAFFVLAGAAMGWHWREAITDSAIALSADAGFRLERVEIEGRFNTDRETLMQTAGLDWHAPMLGLDLAVIHDRLVATDWARAVRVERHLPSTLVIVFDERSALALFQTGDGHRVIDRDGNIIANAAAEAFTHLPVIKGEGGAAEANTILTILKREPELYAEVWSLTYQSGRRWNVYLRNNIRIQLPEDDPEAAWKKLAEMDRAHRLTERDIINIDLRVPGKLVIRPRRTAPRKGSST